MKIIQSIRSLLLLFSLPVSVLAENLPVIVITGTPLPTPVVKLAINTTVITREHIERTQPHSVMKLLENQAGIYINHTGNFGSLSTVYLRGGDPNFTLVLIDGVKVNDPNDSRGGTFDFANLDINSIERIEILRGPLSSIYGSDAISGVINIISRHEESGSDVLISFGEDKSENLSLSTTKTYKGINLSINASQTKDSDIPEVNRFQRKQLGLSVVLNKTEDNNLRIHARRSEAEAESLPEDSGGTEFSVSPNLEKRDTQSSIFGFDFTQYFSEAIETHVEGQFYKNFQQVDTPNISPGTRDPFGLPASLANNIFERKLLRLSSIYQTNKGTRFGVGIESLREKGNSDGQLDLGFLVKTDFVLDRNIHAVFADLEYSLTDTLSAQLGLRKDHVDQSSLQDSSVSVWSPRIGLVYNLSKFSTRLKFNWAEGFKLPSFYALGNPLVGNPLLKSETSNSYEMGLEQSFGGNHFQFQATIYRNNINDLVDFDPGPPPLLVNRSEVVTRGIEFSVKWTDLLGSHLNVFIEYLE